MSSEPTLAIAVRPAIDADASALAELSGQLGYAADAATTARRLRTMRAHGHGEVLVAECSTAIRGWVAVTLSTTLTHDAQAEIVGLVVDAGSRGRGVGAVLVGAAEQWSREHGCAQLRVRSNVLREDAHRFYEREGHLRLKTQVLFGKSLELP